MSDSPAQAAPFRLAVVNSHPIQYFAPLYRYLNQDPGLDVTALYCSDSSLRGDLDQGFGRSVRWDVDLLAGYRSMFLGGSARRRRPAGFWSLICPEVWREIRCGAYDGVLLHGYAYAVDVIAFAAARSRRIPVFVRTETHHGLRRTPWKRRLRDLVLSRAFAFVDGFLAIGAANRAYYRALGVPDRRIFDVPYTVDNDRFMTAANLTAAERAAVRRQYGLPDSRPVVLFASKLIPRKRPEDLVLAAARLRDEGLDLAVWIVGTGALEARLRSLVAEHRLEGVVSFAGFVNQSDLPRVYAAADIFVLPSENEPWGLIVNEVLCAGLPVVVAAEVGCVSDLVHEGRNGVLFPAGDVGALAAALRRLLHDPAGRRAMGREGLAIVRDWSYERCRHGVLAAVRSVQEWRTR